MSFNHITLLGEQNEKQNGKDSKKKSDIFLSCTTNKATFLFRRLISLYFNTPNELVVS